MRYKVRVRLGGRWLDSPGRESIGRRGIRPNVFRVSFRQKDDFVGYLSSYFHVPYVFGSSGRGIQHQTEQYQGADCADVLVGAARQAGARLRYTSVSGMTRYARNVTPRLYIDKSGVYRAAGRKKGTPLSLSFGPRGQVRRGDLMLIDYVEGYDSPRSWDHIAILTQDLGRRGALDPADKIMNMDDNGLITESLLIDSALIVRFQRFKSWVRRSFRRHQRRLKARRRLRKRRLQRIMRRQIRKRRVKPRRRRPKGQRKPRPTTPTSRRASP